MPRTRKDEAKHGMEIIVPLSGSARYRFSRMPCFRLRYTGARLGVRERRLLLFPMW